MFLELLLIILFALISWLLYNNITLAIIMGFTAIIFVLVAFQEQDEFRIKSLYRRKNTNGIKR